METIHQKLERNRKPRVHIKYEVETGSGTAEKELPFVAGVMGNFSGNVADNKQPYKERQFINIDPDNFNQVMQRIKPTVQYQVDNVLEEGKTMDVNLTFSCMEDFEPGNLVENIPELQNLMKIRNQLKELLSRSDRSEILEQILENALKNQQDLNQLSTLLSDNNEASS